jgi:two-component SAPR family response regulator
MEKRSIRIVLNEDTFRKYKVYCAIANISMTDQTNIIVQDFVKDMETHVKIIKISADKDMQQT